MDKSMKMKSEVLEMLKDFMMGEQGKKIKPKAIEVSMITDKPKEGLDKVLDEASKYEDSPEDEMIDEMLAKKKGMSKEDWEDSPEDEMVDEAVEHALEDEECEDEDEYSRGGMVKPRMSLQEFLSRK